MQVTYALDPSDYWNYNTLSLRRKPILALRWFASLLVLPLVIAILVDLLANPSLAVAVGLAAGVIWSIFAVARLKRTLQKRASELATYGRSTTASVDKNGLHLANEVVDLAIDWSLVKDLFQDRRVVCFQLNPSFAYVIPKRSFASDVDARSFTTAATSYWLAAKDSSPGGAANQSEQLAPASESSAESVSYDLNHDDAVQFVSIALKRAPGSRRPVLVIVGTIDTLIGVAMIIFGFAHGPGVLSQEGLIWFGGLCLGLGIMMLWSSTGLRTRRVASRIVASTPGLVGRASMRLLQDKFVKKSAHSREELAWKAVHSVVDEADFILIYETSWYVHAIPKRAFRSAGEALEFFHTARSYQVQAKTGALAAQPVEGVWPPAPRAHG